MSEKDVADLVEEWQTGLFLILASAVAGLVVEVALPSPAVPFGAAIGGVGGAVAAFLALSFLLYRNRGRVPRGLTPGVNADSIKILAVLSHTTVATRVKDLNPTQLCTVARNAVPLKTRACLAW